MRVRILASIGLLAFTLIIGCDRKRLPGEGGSSSKSADVKKTPEVAQHNPQSGQPAPAVAPQVNPESNEVAVKPPIVIPPTPKINPGPPPDWANVGKQEWAPNEKVILSAEDAQNYIPGTLRVSPDGGHFAYARKFEDGEAMFVDGKELTRIKSITPTLIEFSKDSKHLVYAGQKSEEEGGAWIRDDEIKLIAKVEGGFNINHRVRKFHLTPDAAEIGFDTTSGSYIANGKYLGDSAYVNTAEKLHYASVSSGRVSVDGVEQKQFEAISGFQFSDNGKNFGYVVTQSGEQFVVFGKSEERPYQKVDSLVLSPDGKRYAHRVEHEGKQYLVIEGKPKAYAGSFKRSVLFSPDSNRWAVVLDNKVIVDHVADSEYRAVDASSLSFSPDGRHYAYVAKSEERTFVILDGKELGYSDAKEIGRFEAIARAPIFSPDGQSLAYLTQSGGKWAIYINGKKHAEVPHDPNGRWVLEFSPDSKSIGYAASVDLTWHILLDGKLIEKNEPIGAEGTRIGFGPDGSFTYVVKRKNAYYWVTEKRKG